MTAPVLTWNMGTSYFESSSACTANQISTGPVWGWQLYRESSIAMGGMSGPKEKLIRVPLSILPCHRKEKIMSNRDVNAVDVLLVEDNPRDAELTIRALKKNHLANQLYHV